MNPQAGPRRPRSNWAPLHFETDLAALPLQGRLPDGLHGTLVRNGPNPVAPDPGTHLFTGEGMLHAFHLAGGQVSYRNRWVRTSRWELAHRTGHTSAPGGLRGALGRDDSGTANTNVISHAGRMLALEEAHLPVALDPATLDTLGVADFDGGLHHCFTAHPKTDPRTGELLFFGYGTPEPFTCGMSFGVLSAAGRVTRFERFEAPYAGMVHDFAITERHVVFPLTPITASRERAERRGMPFAWEPSFGTRVGIMPRAGTTGDIVWWSGPPCYVFHVMNAWDRGRQLFLDVMRFDLPPLFPHPDGTLVAGRDSTARLSRWTFDLDHPERGFTETVLEEMPGEFPRIDERFTGRPYRHGWFAGHTPAPTGRLRLHSSVVHVDHAAPRADVFTFEGHDHVSEPVFVPRGPKAAEGDGWVLATVWRADLNLSDLVVFDATRIAAGPVCIASLPHRVPDGFHGNWFAGAQAMPPEST